MVYPAKANILTLNERMLNRTTEGNFKYVRYHGVYANGTSGSAITIDWRNGNIQSLTLSAACVVTFIAPEGPADLRLILTISPAGAKAVTWPNTVKWPGGIKPTHSTGSSAVDVVAFIYDGTNYYGTAGITFS